jgi:hypothetical protein
MKNVILLLTIIFFITTFVSAQKKNIVPEKEKLIIEINYGFATSKTFFKGETITSIDPSLSRNRKPQFAVGISGKAYKFLYLKTVLGTNYINNLLEVNFTYNNGTNQQTILSDYSANYLYLSILPELRFTDASKTLFLFANSGLSTYACINNEFYGGGIVSGMYTAKEMASQLRGFGLAWETNTGLGVKFNNTGMNIAVGYVHVAAQKENKAITFIPALGFTQFRLFIGIVYSIN